MKKRPFGVTVLAILAGLLAVLSGVHALQARAGDLVPVGDQRAGPARLWHRFRSDRWSARQESAGAWCDVPVVRATT